MIFDKSNYNTLAGWETDFVQDTIRSWKRELGPNEAEDDYEAFILTIQEHEPNVFNVSIEVALSNRVGDLLSAEFTEECHSAEAALEQGRTFIWDIKEKYDLD